MDRQQYKIYKSATQCHQKPEGGFVVGAVKKVPEDYIPVDLYTISPKTYEAYQTLVANLSLGHPSILSFSENLIIRPVRQLKPEFTLLAQDPAAYYTQTLCNKIAEAALENQDIVPIVQAIITQIYQPSLPEQYFETSEQYDKISSINLYCVAGQKIEFGGLELS